MTKNKYWLFLESLRRSGATNMYGAAPYLKAAFEELSTADAHKILADWMVKYDSADYVVSKDEIKAEAYRIYTDPDLSPGGQHNEMQRYLVARVKAGEISQIEKCKMASEIMRMADPVMAYEMELEGF